MDALDGMLLLGSDLDRDAAALREQGRPYVARYWGEAIRVASRDGFALYDRKGARVAD